MSNNVGSLVAFMPLRGGSKSIPRKNIKLLNGRPLAYWALDAVVKCEDVDRVLVSTDCPLTKNVISEYGSKKVLVIGRSEEVSSDTATTESVMLEFARDFVFDDIVLVQATSPLLQSEHVAQGIVKYKREHLDSVVSVVRQKRFIWEVGVPSAIAVNYDPSKRPRRQEQTGFLVENGAFYITSRSNLMETRCRLSGKIGVVEMPEDTYYELDEPVDWIIVEKLLQRSLSDGGPDVTGRLQLVKCVLTDCDGVLTNGGMYYSENGDELKRFNARDGMGFQLLRERGIFTGIITGEDRELVRKRASKLEADVLFMGIRDKAKTLRELCETFNLRLSEIAYLGDDINDLDVIREVGFGCAVADGADSVKEAAVYVTQAKGGEGAFREVADMILRSHEKSSFSS